MTVRRARSLLCVFATALLLVPAISIATLSIARDTLAAEPSRQPIDYVDVFIGASGTGHTTPAATAPFGAVQVGPDTRQTGWGSVTGYQHGDEHIIGFTHTHLSGAGCLERLDVMLMPGIANASRYESERARPGYYGVRLVDAGVGVRIAAAQHSALHEYRFDRGRARQLVLDLKQRSDKIVTAFELSAAVGSREAWGLLQTRAVAKGPIRHVHFHLSFSAPIVANTSSNNGARLLLRFDQPQPSSQLESSSSHARAPSLLVKAGLSPVDVDGAARNAKLELGEDSIEEVHARTRRQWSEWLDRIQVRGRDERHKSVFYTSLYRALLAPNVFQDADGRYADMDRVVHTARPGDTQYAAEPPARGAQPSGASAFGHPRALAESAARACSCRFTMFSLWDTYRALHPFLNLFAPHTNGQMVQSLLERYRVSGRLPQWASGPPTLPGVRPARSAALHPPHRARAAGGRSRTPTPR